MSGDDYTDETHWQRLNAASAPVAPPNELGPPPTHPAAAALDFHSASWQWFEALLHAVIRRIEDPFDLRLYGRQGQEQYGIDLVGFFNDREPSVYQSKQVQTFTKSDLTAAVEKFADQRRPFNAKRFVLIVACSIADTKIDDELGKLRKTYNDLTIELWGPDRLAEHLRKHHDLVTRFFGKPVADAFSDAKPAEPAAAPTGISVDALLRGPVAHLQKTPQLRQAMATLSSDPAAAAALFGDVADALDTTTFDEHAAEVRRQQAAALEAAEQFEAAAQIRIRLGWHAYHAFNTVTLHDEYLTAMNHLPALSEGTQRSVNVLAFAAALGHQAELTIDDFAAAYDEVQDADLGALDATVALAEHATALGRTDVVQQRADLLRVRANTCPSDDAGLLLRARILACVAEASEAWPSLTMDAREIYPPAAHALILARHARVLANTGHPEQSLQRWLDAIEVAAGNGFNDAAADWYYAERTTRLHYGFRYTGPDRHYLAQALRSAGGGNVLPGRLPLSEQALSRIAEQKWPQALELLHQFLRRAVATASWADEFRAHELFGDLFAQTGRYDDAIRHYIKAGRSDRISALASHLPDQAIELTAPPVGDPVWVQVAAFKAAGLTADLLPDPVAVTWAAAGLEVLSREAQAPTRLLLAALDALVQLAPALTADQAQQAVQLGQRWLVEQHTEYSRTHRTLAKVLATAAERHPAMRADIVGQLCSVITGDYDAGRHTVIRARNLLRQESTIAEARLTAPAAEGNVLAAIGLVYAGVDGPAATALAEEVCTRVMQPPVLVPGGGSILGTSEVDSAILAVLLNDGGRAAYADAMLARARDPMDQSENRDSALNALSLLVPHLSSQHQAQLFGDLMAFAAAPIERLNDWQANNGPFERFKIILGDVPLDAVAVEVAAECAAGPSQFQQVQDAIANRLPRATTRSCSALARALTAIPVAAVTLDVRLLASHPEPSIRAAAAAVWAADPNRWPGVDVTLAADPAAVVRRSLAAAAHGAPAHAAMVAALQADPRRSVRQRAAAALHEAPTPPGP